MELKFKEKLGDGGFGDVWEARDVELDRDVAVKLCREAGAAVSSALDHARALAKVDHPNVVRVYTVTSAKHPDTGDELPAVVMELVRGQTLTSVFEESAIPLQTARNIGRTLLEGLQAIHKCDIPHGDLHTDNVMITEKGAIIIDILRMTKTLPTADRRILMRRDISDARIMLTDLLSRSGISAQDVLPLAILPTAPTLQEIEQAWSEVADPSSTVASHVERACARITDPWFDESDEYAKASANEIPDNAVPAVFSAVIERRLAQRKHSRLLRTLRSRLSEESRSSLLLRLSDVLDKETPAGSWGAPMTTLYCLGKDAWTGLRAASAIRLERVLINDVLSGRYDIYKTPALQAGKLATHAKGQWRHFADPKALFVNIIAMLRKDWYTQNYVAECFLEFLVELSAHLHERTEAIQAIASALSNNPKHLEAKVLALPEDWRNDIAEVRAGQGEAG
jgi:serine/threonine-protein kinase RIO1